METQFQDSSELKVHHGHNVQRIREIIGYKQITLAEIVKVSQQSISKWEQTEELSDEVLERLGEGLGVTADFIKNFKEEKAIYNIQNHNTFTVSDNAAGINNQPKISHDGSDKLVLLLEKFIEEDRVKTQSIANLSKAVLDLAEEVKKLKSNHN